MKYELKTVGIWAFVKVSFLLNLVFGFLIGLLYAGFLAVILTISSALPYGGSGDFDPDAIGPMVLIMLPFVLAIFGAVFHTLLGLIIIGVYNLITKMVGGLEFVLEPVAEVNRYVPAQPVTPSPQPSIASVPPPPPPEQAPMSQPEPPRDEPPQPPSKLEPPESTGSQSSDPDPERL